jgi:hypothetical protein
MDSIMNLQNHGSYSKPLIQSYFTFYVIVSVSMGFLFFIADDTTRKLLTNESPLDRVVTEVQSREHRIGTIDRYCYTIDNLNHARY